ncbi:MAG: SprB repeat-containing protein, partial [Sphingobacteriales bacterium]|nr:SprB repeat-containing protein [Sphingobacteriales bacterium]
IGNNLSTESSDVFFQNNTLDGSGGIVPFVQYTRQEGDAVGASSSFTAENNTVSGTAVAGTTTLLGSMNLIFANSVLNQSLTVRNNKISYNGDLSTVEGQFIRPIMIRGNLKNSVVEKNEITLSGTNLQPRNPANILPVCPAITLYTENGSAAFLQPGSVINILNNKVNGFKHSFVAFDAGTGTGANDAYTGFGNIPAGVTVNVNNNSFTGDSISINNGTVGQPVLATCNWYGSADAAVVIPKISGIATYGSWLTNGTDNNIATGFQPVSNTCNGRQNKFYVNDGSQTDDVFTTAVGNDANSGVPSSPLLTINAALTKASAGDTIYVDAGTYANADITIGKSITLLGTNYLTNPNDGTNPLNAAGRTAEANISNTIWTIGFSDIRIKGFTFDPQSKTALAQSNNTLDFDNIEVSNNIFLVKSVAIPVSLIGKQQLPLVTFNYSITNNRFVKSVGGNGSNISMAGIDGILISGNTFTTTGGVADWTQNAYTGFGGFRNNNFVISNNTAYRPRFAFQGLNAVKAQVSLNKITEAVRFQLDFNGINVPTEINITDNNVTIANSNGAPALSYSKSNGTDLSSPNIARIERNNFTVDGTGWSLVPQALIAPTIDNLSANTQVFIRDNKLNITGNFSTQSDPGNYVSAIRFLNNSRQVVVERNEMQFSATNYGTSNKFGIGILYAGLQPGTSFDFLNNKFSGFSTSIGVQNNGNNNNYGELPAGVILNINNNSFTGDVTSINNGTTGQSATASCNWYGSAAAQNFISKLTLPTVDPVPWLTNGTDNDVATGFQQVPGSCDGYPTLITLDSYTNVTCNGAANGTINITTTNGKAPFIYTWTKDGDANFISHDEDPTGLAPGVYHLAMVDGNGSNIYITAVDANGPGTIVVTITEPPVLTASATGTNNNCFGQTTGTATVSVSGGTSSYTYLWSNGATTQSISNLSAAIYSVIVTDANGCTATTSYEVTEPPALSASATGSNVNCNGGSAGSASVSVSGGTSSYTYLWSNGA